MNTRSLVLSTILIVMLPVTTASAQPVLILDGVCPGPMHAEIQGARPNAGIALVYSPRRGWFRIPWYYWCEGAILRLNPRGIQVVESVGTDENGSATFEGYVSAGACGGYLQTLSYPSGGCETSNVVQIPEN